MFNKLKTFEELDFSECEIGWDLLLRTLESIKIIKFPEKLGGNVQLNSLKSLDGMIFPDELTYEIYCKGFVVTPENVNEFRNGIKNSL